MNIFAGSVSLRQLKSYQSIKFFSSALKLSSGVFTSLHPQTINNLKSDNNYISDNFICITDGAMSWKNLQDPYKYSQVLLETITSKNNTNHDKYVQNLEEMVKEAQYEIKETVGGTNCLIFSFDVNNSMLYSYSIGDCGYLLLRKSEETGKIEILFKKFEKTKNFNKSHQISNTNDFLRFGTMNKHESLENDIIISGSDGLFDNLYQMDLIDCIKPFIEHNVKILDIELIADIIGKFALNKSLERSYYSPFAKNAYEYYVDYIGGKPDDITAIVSQLVKK